LTFLSYNDDRFGPIVSDDRWAMSVTEPNTVVSVRHDALSFEGVTLIVMVFTVAEPFTTLESAIVVSTV
jgi:hypothetical protein